ncbi:MAG: HlyD family efflux transporter periplasmic adaptor subunit [Reyranella sp.]|nr:HlyD family efflux transporter periplasmic adaptor subunit [Reyranella sp.]
MTDNATARPPLFRPEVAQRNWELLASKGLMPRPPLFTGAIIALLLVAFAGGAFFLARGAVPRVESAQGYLEPAGGVARVRAPRQAIVEAVHVKDGQLVQRGDLLVTLQSGQITPSGATAETQISGQLQTQRQDIEAQLSREQDWRRNEERRLIAKVDDLVHDLDLLERNIATQQEQMALAQRQAERIRNLAERGTISLDELQRREIAALNQKLAVQTSEREQSAKRAELVQARIALEQLPTLASERQRTLRDSLANTQQRLIELEARRSVVVRAPTAGRLAAIPALAGSAIENGGLIATIVPDGAELRARLFVPTRSIGKVHAGQAVALRYDAFPYQKYGSFKGRVEDVSSSVLLPQEIEKVAPVKVGEPAYVLEVVLERQTVPSGGAGLAQLRPDMTLTAMIEIDRRPLLAWIGDSLFGISQ